MNVTEQDITVVISGIVAVGGFFTFIIKYNTRFSKLELKIDTLWEHLWQRGQIELLQKGVAIKNSPLRISPIVAATKEQRTLIEQTLKELAAPLKKLYDAIGRNLPDSQLAFEIQLRYGREIADMICPLFGVNQGGCLIIASALAKGEKIEVLLIENGRHNGVDADG